MFTVLARYVELSSTLRSISEKSTSIRCPSMLALQVVLIALPAALNKAGSCGALQMSSRHPEAKGKAWIFKKKEQARRKGYASIPVDTKYTGRKRKAYF